MSQYQAIYDEKRRSVEELVAMIEPGEGIVLAAAGSEPLLITQALNNAKQLKGNRLYRMLSMSPVVNLAKDQLKQFTFFLSGLDRKAMRNTDVDLIPSHFSEIPAIIKQREPEPVMISQASPMDEDGYFSFGLTAAYTPCTVEFAKKVFLEVNENMPHTHGEGMRIHISEVTAFVESSEDVVELPDIELSDKDRKIGEYVGDIIEDGSTIQIGFGTIPNAVMNALSHKKNLGIHTEMLLSSIVDLYNNKVITNEEKPVGKHRFSTTLALGNRRLYDFIDNNEDVEILPVNFINNIVELAKIENLVSVNTTLEIDFLGQCNSEQLEDFYYSGTGGQSDFAVGARIAANGVGIVCLYSTAKDDTISRIVPHLHSGSPVSTSKNDIEIVVTEYGVAHLKGKSIQERVQALIEVAHPKFRDGLREEAIKLGYLENKKLK
ncbi:acetyl-CoA hydrolase/transferase family protein [Facklamia sp. P12932]|uniref:acetyl-CoA hydrolase/transferase family protein n=1 Tax=Facklamia sp. P12932 TaxID=3421947 RepID=UPI003D1837FE